MHATISSFLLPVKALLVSTECLSFYPHSGHAGCRWLMRHPSFSSQSGGPWVQLCSTLLEETLLQVMGCLLPAGTPLSQHQTLPKMLLQLLEFVSLMVCSLPCLAVAYVTNAAHKCTRTHTHTHTHTRTHTHTYTHTYTHTHTHAHIHTHIRTHIYIHMHTQTHTHTRTHTQTHTYSRARMHTHTTHACMHRCTHTCMHTCTHTCVCVNSLLMVCRWDVSLPVDCGSSSVYCSVILARKASERMRSCKAKWLWFQSRNKQLNTIYNT